MHWIKEIKSFNLNTYYIRLSRKLVQLPSYSKRETYGFHHCVKRPFWGWYTAFDLIASLPSWEKKGIFTTRSAFFQIWCWWRWLSTFVSRYSEGAERWDFQGRYNFIWATICDRQNQKMFVENPRLFQIVSGKASTHDQRILKFRD